MKLYLVKHTTRHYETIEIKAGLDSVVQYICKLIDESDDIQYKSLYKKQITKKNINQQIISEEFSYYLDIEDSDEIKVFELSEDSLKAFQEFATEPKTKVFPLEFKVDSWIAQHLHQFPAAERINSEDDVRNALDDDDVSYFEDYVDEAVEMITEKITYDNDEYYFFLNQN